MQFAFFTHVPWPEDTGRNRSLFGVVCEPDFNDGVVLNIAPLWELVP
jgi:hypothetical protein